MVLLFITCGDNGMNSRVYDNNFSHADAIFHLICNDVRLKNF